MRIQPTQNTQNRPKFGALEFKQISNPRILTAIEKMGEKFDAPYKITINEDGKLGAILESKINDEPTIIKFLDKFFKS